MKHHLQTATDESAAWDEATEQHHGDLRKGAYLRRRAAYQLQADAGSITQAGTLPAGRQSGSRIRNGG